MTTPRKKKAAAPGIMRYYVFWRERDGGDWQLEHDAVFETKTEAEKYATGRLEDDMEYEVRIICGYEAEVQMNRTVRVVIV